MSSLVSNPKLWLRNKGLFKNVFQATCSYKVPSYLWYGFYATLMIQTKLINLTRCLLCLALRCHCFSLHWNLMIIINFHLLFVWKANNVCRLCKQEANEEHFGKFFVEKQSGFSVHQYCMVRRLESYISYVQKQINHKQSCLYISCSCR